MVERSEQYLALALKSVLRKRLPELIFGAIKNTRVSSWISKFVMENTWLRHEGAVHTQGLIWDPLSISFPRTLVSGSSQLVLIVAAVYLLEFNLWVKSTNPIVNYLHKSWHIIPLPFSWRGWVFTLVYFRQLTSCKMVLYPEPLKCFTALYRFFMFVLLLVA